MDPVNNNQFEIKPSKSKRKIVTPCPNVYLNPALDLLANEDPMCNTAMEIVPNKKRKQTQSCDIAVFENSALDLGISKAAVNEFLVRELENVRKNLRAFDTSVKTDLDANLEPKTNVTDCDVTFEPLTDVSEPKIIPKITTEPIYANLSDLAMNEVNLPISTSSADLFMNGNVPIFMPAIGSYLSNMSVPVSNVDDSLNLQNTMEISTILPLEESKVEMVDTVNFQNCMDVSKIDNEVNSGISVLEQKSMNAASTTQLDDLNLSPVNMTTNIQTNVTNQIFVNNTSNLNFSFIDRLALDSPNATNQSYCLDDDLNESNIMEIKTITIITKKKRIVDKRRNTNPFLDRNLDVNVYTAIENPFITDSTPTEMEYNDEVLNRPVQSQIPQVNITMPKRLFANDTNSTISTVNESSLNNEYENVDGYRSESPIYENIGEEAINLNYNKQSKLLGHDVSRFSAIDIMNINKSSQTNSSNESNDSKKDFKHQILKVSNKLSKKVLKTLRNTFKSEKPNHNVTLNPYEVPRKPTKEKSAPKEAGIENPALNLDNSDESEIDEIDDDEHHYETVKTLRNTQLNMNVTPLRERVNEIEDISHNKTNTPGKKVRFDSTLNQEKFITGNSFDCDVQSPGFDAKIDKYHDELENCINERKFLQQNM